MRKLLLALVASSALAFGSSANAAEIITGINSTTLNSTGTSGPFGAVITGQPSFNNVFPFTLNVASETNGQVSTISLVTLMDINFTSIFIDVNDASHAFVQTSIDPSPEVWALLNPVTLTSGSHTLFVNGNLAPNVDAASYSATLNISPVPEPAAWMMMLMGFGVVGLAMRSRRNKAIAQIA